MPSDPLCRMLKPFGFPLESLRKAQCFSWPRELIGNQAHLALAGCPDWPTRRVDLWLFTMTEIHTATGFVVGKWRVDPLAGAIFAGDTSHRVEPKVMDVLVCLARRAGQVVERDTIIAEVWPHRFVSDDPLARCITELRRVLGDSAQRPSYIETIPKRGYRLLAKVQAVPPSSAAESNRAHTRVRWWSSIIVGVLVLSVCALYYFRPKTETDPPVAPLTAIAVLPFADLSAATEHLFVGDGLVELLIHRLSQLPELAVISRNSSFA